MPFSSLHDPAALARAQRILDGAFAKLVQSGMPTVEMDRTDLAYIVAGLLGLPQSDEEITEAAVARFIEGQQRRGRTTLAGAERACIEPAAAALGALEPEAHIGRPANQ